MLLHIASRDSARLARPTLFLFLLFGIWIGGTTASAQEDSGPSLFRPIDVFELEYASDPQIAPHGKRIAYVRNSMDIMTDRVRTRIWLVDHEGKYHRPITDWEAKASSPRWSPDGTRLAYVAGTDEGAQIFVRWMDTGETARLTNVRESPQGLTWSPDGNWLSFGMLTSPDSSGHADDADADPKSTNGKFKVELPAKPEGAEWAEPPKSIDRLVYRSDGAGYLKEGHTQLYILPSDGGTPRQLTYGAFQHDAEAVWSPEGDTLYFSGNRHKQWEYRPLNSEVYKLTLKDAKIRALTTREGADEDPTVSRDGRKIAFVGFDDEGHSYHQSDLYVMNRDGTERRNLTEDFDNSVQAPSFSRDGRSVIFQYDVEGNTAIGQVDLESGAISVIAGQVGGTTLGRPYASGSYSLADNGRIAYTHTTPYRPADVAVAGGPATTMRVVTTLNDDLLAHKNLAEVEPFWFESSHDQRKIQGWIVKPPQWKEGEQYPLILEIHGGPFANYGDRFSVEMQLYAAAGYVVLYVNPRGSTSYGLEFASLIERNYPSEDYDDLMSGVDAVIDRGYVDPERLYVTGGSGGGVLSSWIVGKTNRFRAAAVAKPVINWYSFALTADHYNFFARYWFGEFPWENPQEYMRRSPISLVGNVSTPTMLITGESDYRTPISETEQFYQALKLRRVDALLVRVPGASHGIAARPSHLIAKVGYILKWFETHP